jgi:ATP-dependent Clp protease ATP-binding subunit ClpC
MNIQLTITASMKTYLVEKYYDKKMGARPLKRAIQTQIEDLLAEEVLEGKILEGDKVQVLRKKEQTVFKKND